MGCALAGDRGGALRSHEAALALKLTLYPEASVHVCISLSGVADAFLSLAEEGDVSALAAAEATAQRYAAAAKALGDADQRRIAHEILADIAAERRKAGLPELPRGTPMEAPPRAEDRGVLSAASDTPGGRSASFGVGTRCSSGCGLAASKKCSGCGTARYCSADCQKQHWPLHKRACKVIRASAAAAAAAAEKSG